MATEDESAGPWGNRDFVLFAVNRGGVVFGSQVLTVAVGWHVYSETGNVIDLGLIGLAQFLPALGLFLLAGLAADRLDRRLIIAVCSAVSGLAIATIGLFIAGRFGFVWPVFALLGLHGISRAFFMPANQAVLPNIVPRDMLPSAIASTASITKVGQLGGPAAGGALIALVDTGVYAFAAVCFAIAAVTAIMIRVPLVTRDKEPFSMATVLGGFTYIWNKKVVLGAISIDLVAVLFGGVMGLLPVFAIDILNVGPELLGLLRAAPAIGALAVGIVLARSRLPWHVGLAFFVSLGIFGVSTLVFSLSTAFWLSFAALLVNGGADMISVYIRQTLVQLQTPDELRGRVSAVNAISINASNELGDFRGGVFAAAFGTVPAVFLGGLMVLGATAGWWKLFPDLRSFERL